MRIYVVRSAEVESVPYAAVPTLEDAKRVIVWLEERDESEGIFDTAFDYDIVESFDNAKEAIEHIRNEDS